MTYFLAGIGGGVVLILLLISLAWVSSRFWPQKESTWKCPRCVMTISYINKADLVGYALEHVVNEHIGE